MDNNNNNLVTNDTITTKDEYDKVVCPICNKKYKYLNNLHLKTHGYSSEKEFRVDYPTTKMRTDEVNSNMKKSFRKLNQDSDHQASSAKVLWSDPEFRRSKSDHTTDLLRRIYHTDEYPEARSIMLGNLRGRKSEYITTEGVTLRLRSFLEARVAKFLELNNLEFSYESVEIPYVLEGVTRRYYPDFYLERYNLLIEVKPLDLRELPYVVDKMNAALSEGYNFMFISEDIIDNYEYYLSEILSYTVVS